MLWDDLRGYVGTQTLADCIPHTLGINPGIVKTVHLRGSSEGPGTTTELSTPIGVCKQFGATDVIITLQEVSKAKRTSLIEVVMNGSLEDVRGFFGAQPPYASECVEALHMASMDGKTDIVQFLLEAGVDANCHDDGWTPLLQAASNGHREAVSLLVIAGANLEAKDEEYQRSPLLWAAYNRHCHVVAQLLELNADINAVDGDVQSSVMLAISQNQHDIILMLVEGRADVNHRGDDGMTALMMAAIKGDESIVQLMVDHGADVHQQTVEGKSALHMAAAGGYSKVVDILKDHGACVAQSDSQIVQGLLDAAKKEIELHKGCGSGCAHHH